MTTSTPPRRNHLTIEQKIAMCEYAKKIRTKGKLSHTALAAWATRTFDLVKPPSRDTARRIVEREAEWAAMPPNQTSRKLAVRHNVRESDGRIMSEFTGMDGVVEATTGKSIKVLDIHVDAFGDGSQEKRSNGWLYRFQKRHGIAQKRTHGEAASVDQDAAEAGHVKIRKLPDQYPRSEIYNMDETAFFFRSGVKTTLTQKKKVSGRKDPKTRITLGLAVNADGSDKLPPLYIGSAAVPRPLKGIDVWEKLGALYAHSKKAWMNSIIFQTWLRAVNLQMQRDGRSILPLVDNVSSHAQPASAMSNVRLEFLPKNTTSCLQPLDQGIIRALKSKYSDIKVFDSIDLYLARREQEKVDIYTALRWSKTVFDEISPETIKNCWKHADILSDRSKISALLNPSN